MFYSTILQCLKCYEGLKRQTQPFWRDCFFSSFLHVAVAFGKTFQDHYWVIHEEQLTKECV